MADEDTEPGGNDSGGTTPSEEPASTPHLRYEAVLRLSLTRRSEIHTWEGDEAAIVAKFLATKIGEVVPEGETAYLHLSAGGSPTSGEPWAEARVAEVSAPRRQGKVWTMQVTVTQLRYLTIWTLDFADVDKPIRTWHAGTTNGPDLAMLSKWELAGEKQDWTNYDDYKTVDGTSLTGETLDLAKMIREDGIESYTIHTPVATCQITYPTFPDGAGGLLDCWLPELPAPVGGWPDMGGYTESAVRDQIDGLKSGFGGSAGEDGVWLCTADPVHPNADGTFTRSTQFTLVSSVNENLYSQGDPTAGGFQSSQSGGSGESGESQSSQEGESQEGGT